MHLPQEVKALVWLWGKLQVVLISAVDSLIYRI